MEFFNPLKATKDQVWASVAAEIASDATSRKVWAQFKDDRPELAWEVIAKRRVRSGDSTEWDAFVAKHPEYADRKPSMRVSYGSGEDMTPGNCWKDVDQGRFVRNRSRKARRRPTSDMTMPDGSPLRPSGEYLPLEFEPPADFEDHVALHLDDDGNLLYNPKTDFEGVSEDRDPMGGEPYPIDPDELGSDVELYDEFGAEIGVGGSMFDGIHGWVEQRSERQDTVHGRMLELCLLCASPLPLKWVTSECECDGEPLNVRGLDGEPLNACHCNGCLGMPKRSQGRLRLCSDVCRKRMDNGMDRANRRAAGRPSRPSAADPDADRIAESRVGLRVRAAQRKVDEARYRSGVTPPPWVWVMPPHRQWMNHPLVLTQQGNVWKVTA